MSPNIYFLVDCYFILFPDEKSELINLLMDFKKIIASEGGARENIGRNINKATEKEKETQEILRNASGCEQNEPRRIFNILRGDVAPQYLYEMVRNEMARLQAPHQTQQEKSLVFISKVEKTTRQVNLVARK